MNDPVHPLFPVRERRILLWVCAAAVCWRWLLAVRTPLPLGVEELWAGTAVAAGELGALGGVWLGPWWSLLLAPAIVGGADPFEAAQLLGSVVGGVALVPVAIAAQRLREGAGVPAALLCFSMPAPTIFAAAGSPVALQALWVGLLLWAFVAQRHVAAAAFAVIAIADAFATGPFLFSHVRSGWSLALPLAILAILAPRPRAVGLWIALGLALLTAVVGVAWLWSWSPVVAVLAGVGLARLPLRLRDLALTVTAAFMFYEAYAGVEPATAVVERHLGEFVAERLAPGQALVTDLPRVAFYAGRRPRPEPGAGAGLVERLAAADAGAAVLLLVNARRLQDQLGERYVRFRLSPRFEDLADQHGVAVWFRRE